MTNPGNAVGVNAAYGGRTSVNAFNDWANFYSSGIVSGFVATPSSGMTVNVGGTPGIRDVALAEDPNGNKTSISNRTASPIPVTFAAASTTATRRDSIVAYVNSPTTVTGTTVDNPGACGIITVQGSSTTPPTDSAIRTAITSDGGTGTTAYYVVLATATMPANTTTITSEMLTFQGYAQLGSHSVDWATHWGELAYTNNTGTARNLGSSPQTVHTYTATNGGIFSCYLSADAGNAAGTSCVLNADIQVGGSTVMSANDVSRPNYAGNNNANVFVAATLKVDAGATIGFRISQSNRTSDIDWRAVLAQIY